MDPLPILLVSDGRPGHYHLAEGVIAAIARKRAVTVTRMLVRRRRLTPTRFLARLLRLPLKAGSALRMGYGVRAETLGRPRLVVSAGGETLAALADAARFTGADSIYCGSVRHLPPEMFSAVVTSYNEHQSRPNHIVALKPSAISREEPAHRTVANRPGTRHPPHTAALLIGGDSGLFHYGDGDWAHLVAFLRASHREAGIKWLVSTSPRSPSGITRGLAAIAAEPESPIAEFIDYRHAGPGTLDRILSLAECVVCTEDSSTMISEAVSAQLPVVGVSPVRHDFKTAERNYRDMMHARGLTRSIALADLTPSALLSALDEITPMPEPPLDLLARELEARLPQLFR